MIAARGEKVVASVEMREWERREPASGSALHGVYLPTDALSRRAAETLTERGMLRLEEMRHGLAVESTSFVGRVRVGDLAITIHPKIDALPLLRLLRYTYGLRDLTLVGANIPYATAATTPFHEILIHQLAAEVRALLARGLHRAYRRVEESLARPRGRIDMAIVARDSAMGRLANRATLPCIHYERSDKDPLHQSLHAGLRLASRLTDDGTMRTMLRGLTLRLESAGIAPSEPGVSLTHLLHESRRAQTRLTAAYHAALTLIELLHAGDIGPTLNADDEVAPTVALPGFLFDMNRFFQALLGRFLAENLPAPYTVRSERGLSDLFAYHPDYNPRRRAAPTPRPDYAICRQGNVIALLDAKYRDLWERPLPREMLYQLALYAAFGAPRDSGGPDAAPTATILYPTLAPDAREQHVEVRHPANPTASGKATVILRPVDMAILATAIGKDETSGARQELAHALVFGKKD